MSYRGSTEVTKQAHDLIDMLIKDPKIKNIMSFITKNSKVTCARNKSVVNIFKNKYNQFLIPLKRVIEK